MDLALVGRGRSYRTPALEAGPSPSPGLGTEQLSGHYWEWMPGDPGGPWDQEQGGYVCGDPSGGRGMDEVTLGRTGHSPCLLLLIWRMGHQRSGRP